ncbi:hypothetical protein [Lactococcus lactis]|uniref:hypothetical protein n=1 Tax=Lactococcus lactis TaxID=1358 RepID=UPI00288F12DE|nr:hypothetical protein [Lactococcus lactis]MDT2867759.1 hypothetical protein [Lactococcus lactis]
MLFIIITLIIIVLIIFLTILLLPGMAFFNKMSDQKYNADEKDLLTGILTTAISSKEATGEVMTTFVNESRKKMPAKIYLPNKDNIEQIESGAQVLIIESKAGIAYVIPYQQTIY